MFPVSTFSSESQANAHHLALVAAFSAMTSSPYLALAPAPQPQCGDLNRRHFRLPVQTSVPSFKHSSIAKYHCVWAGLRELDWCRWYFGFHYYLHVKMFKWAQWQESQGHIFMDGGCSLVKSNLSILVWGLYFFMPLQVLPICQVLTQIHMTTEAFKAT